MPGFLIAGITVGPSTLGLIDNPIEIGHLAELGVVLLLFVIGIELKPSRLWLMRRLVLVLIVIKIALLWPLVRLFGHKGKLAAAISLLLAQSGEFALVLFAVMFKSTLLTKDLFDQLLVVVVLSMLATPPLARLAYSFAAKINRDPDRIRLADEEPVSAPIVI